MRTNYVHALLHTCEDVMLEPITLYAKLKKIENCSSKNMPVPLQK